MPRQSSYIYPHPIVVMNKAEIWFTLLFSTICQSTMPIRSQPVIYFFYVEITASFSYEITKNTP